MTDIENTVLVCPKNDEESLVILKLAQALGLTTVISRQPHGAKLEKEKKLIERILKLNPNAERVVIVEIPGKSVEEELFRHGFEVKIIDHHQYGDLDRMNEKSSLEQFMDFFDIDSKKAESLGFDFLLLQAVAAIDRGFLWELVELGWGEQERMRSIDYYQSLTKELGNKNRKKQEKLAGKIWDSRVVRRGVIVVENKKENINIREAISFIVAKNFGEPREVVIKQGKRKIYVQDTLKAEELLHAFGGFTFGKNMCWGILDEDGNIPTIDEILRIVAR
ncbi:hypothetical protein KJ766_01510 [Patescibacteria group bacterium]|nr:hypothetical protein [Patescibacteria group bacterium]